MTSRPSEEDENNLPLPLFGKEGNRRSEFPLLAKGVSINADRPSIRPLKKRGLLGTNGEKL